MSGRHPKRSRCVACREGTRNVVTHVMVRQPFNRFGMWVPRQAVLCECCLTNWLSLFEPPDEAVNDWIGLVDGRMWPRRQTKHNSAAVQELLRQLDLARQQEAADDQEDEPEDPEDLPF